MKKFNFYLILLIVFALPSYLIRFDVFGIPTTLLEILIYISAILSLFQILYVKYHIPNYLNKLLIPIILFIIGGAIGIFVAPDKMSALGQFKAYIFDPILFFVILVLNIKTTKDIKLVLYAFLYSGIVVALYSIYQLLSNAPTEGGRVIGIFGYSPNYVAMYLAPLLVIGLFLVVVDWKNNLLSSIFKTILLFIVIYAILLSGSRGAIIAVIGSIGLGYIIRYIYTLKNQTTKIIISILLALMIFVVGYYLIRPDFSVSGGDAGRVGSSNNIRYEIYKTTLFTILPQNMNWLWGVGLGNYQNYFTDISKNWVNYPEYIAPKALSAHNILLHTWVNAGLFALAGMIWLLITFFKKTNFKDQLSYLAMVAMLCILIQGIVDTPYWKNDLAIIFWILIFVSSSLSTQYDKKTI